MIFRILENAHLAPLFLSPTVWMNLILPLKYLLDEVSLYFIYTYQNNHQTQTGVMLFISTNWSTKYLGIPCFFGISWILLFGPPEGRRSYKITSVCRSVSLNHSKKFPKIWHEGRGPLTKKSDRARFWGKNRNWGFFALFFNIPPFFVGWFVLQG